MNDVTKLLLNIDSDASIATEELLPVVYDQLRRLAERELRELPAGLTIQPTALVHEAFIRLVDREEQLEWNHRGHFYAAAATVMRNLLVDNARRRNALKRGGNHQRIAVDTLDLYSDTRRPDLVALDRALRDLEEVKPEAAKLVSLKFFAGLTMKQTALAMGISLRAAERSWTYAKAWLLTALKDDT